VATAAPASRWPRFPGGQRVIPATDREAIDRFRRSNFEDAAILEANQP
jgi:hypothetical protein